MPHLLHCDTLKLKENSLFQYGSLSEIGSAPDKRLNNSFVFTSPFSKLITAPMSIMSEQVGDRKSLLNTYCILTFCVIGIMRLKPQFKKRKISTSSECKSKIIFEQNVNLKESYTSIKLRHDKIVNFTLIVNCFGLPLMFLCFGKGTLRVLPFNLMFECATVCAYSSNGWFSQN